MENTVAKYPIACSFGYHVCKLKFCFYFQLVLCNLK
jgi:hypothetical protein